MGRLPGLMRADQAAAHILGEDHPIYDFLGPAARAALANDVVSLAQHEGIDNIEQAVQILVDRIGGPKALGAYGEHLVLRTPPPGAGYQPGAPIPGRGLLMGHPWGHDDGAPPR